MADDSKPKNPLGPTGRRVAANVAWFRDRSHLTYAALSRRLEELGRPIPVLGLSRIERQERRIDVDDLVALARVLEVSPNKLLFTIEGPPMEHPMSNEPVPSRGSDITKEVPLTERYSMRGYEVDAWVSGRDTTTAQYAEVKSMVEDILRKREARDDGR